MAENQLTPGSDRIRSEAREEDWTSLFARAVDDLTRIVHSEFRLLVAGIKGVMDEEIDRVLAFVVSGVLIFAGALCLLAAIIMFLHEFLQLPWWQSLGITAIAMFVIAFALRSFASRRFSPPAIT